MNNLLKSFNEESLKDAILQAQSQLKTQPQNEIFRFLLVQLYLLNHQYDKAMVHLNILEKASEKNIERAFSIHCYQKMTAALDSRYRFFHEKKMVEVDATSLSMSAIETLLKRLMGDQQQSDDSEEQRRSLFLTLDNTTGVQFSGEAFDPDDLLHGYIECISQQGAYRLCAVDDLESIVFEQPTKPLDCLLQRVHLKWKQANEALPETETLLHINHYPFTRVDLVDLNNTDWDEQLIPSLVVGMGQKVICIGDDVIPVSQIHRIRFG